ncbi:DMT family transporter [Anoxynatronum sibiricum]|uniref:DMT family transporter n=1 Tax=Anoxynatronum sibiricum TaxID=210623 RepID=A0ABU9VWZ2_9CLOT
MTDRKKVILSDVSLLLVAAMWGGGFSFTKNILQYLTPLYFLSARFTLAALVLAMLFFPKVKQATRQDVKNSLFVGVFLTVAFMAQTVGLLFTTPGKQAFITSAYVVMVPFLSYLVSRRKPLRKELAGAFLCMVGLAMLSLTRDMQVNLGDVLTLVSAVGFAGHIVVIGVFANRVDTVVMNVYQFLLAGISCLVLALVLEPFPTSFGFPALYSLAYLVLFSSIGAFMIQVTAQKYTYPTHAGIILSMEAVFGALFAFIFWQEIFTPVMLAGCAVIMIAILITEVDLKKKPAEMPVLKEGG